MVLIFHVVCTSWVVVAAVYSKCVTHKPSDGNNHELVWKNSWEPVNLLEQTGGFFKGAHHLLMDYLKSKLNLTLFLNYWLLEWVNAGWV